MKPTPKEPFDKLEISKSYSISRELISRGGGDIPFLSQSSQGCQRSHPQNSKQREHGEHEWRWTLWPWRQSPHYGKDEYSAGIISWIVYMLLKKYHNFFVIFLTI